MRSRAMARRVRLDVGEYMALYPAVTDIEKAGGDQHLKPSVVQALRDSHQQPHHSHADRPLLSTAAEGRGSHGAMLPIAAITPAANGSATGSGRYPEPALLPNMLLLTHSSRHERTGAAAPINLFCAARSVGLTPDRHTRVKLTLSCRMDSIAEGNDRRMHSRNDGLR
jgi:hypothetical protein